jgi:hypothetical protein
MSFQGTTLHRSGQAELPHPAPTLGEDAQAHERIRMANASRRKPPCDKTLHAAPGQVVTLTATAQRCPPQGAHCRTKGAQRRTIPGHPVIAEVTQAGPSATRLLVPERAWARAHEAMSQWLKANRFSDCATSLIEGEAGPTIAEFTDQQGIDLCLALQPGMQFDCYSGQWQKRFFASQRYSPCAWTRMRSKSQQLKGAAVCDRP